MLEVVQDQQRTPLAQIPIQGHRKWLRARFAQSERPGNRWQELAGLAHRRQVNEHRARLTTNHLKGQPCLAGSACAGQCQQTSPGQQHPRPGQLALPADQGRQRHRKITGRVLTHAFRLAANTPEVQRAGQQLRRAGPAATAPSATLPPRSVASISTVPPGNVNGPLVTHWP